MDEPANKKRRLAPKTEPASRLGDQSAPQSSSQALPLSQAQHNSQSHVQSTPPAQSQPSPSPSGQTLQSHNPPRPPQYHPRLSEAARKEFFDFAQNLQNAAMFFKQRSERPPHSSASVLSLQWEDTDASRTRERDELAQVLKDRFAWKTEKWNIPMINSASQLGDRVTQFFAHARPDQLNVIHYAGHSFVGVDNRLHWACYDENDAPNVGWDSVRCHFEDSQSEVLLLLDCCLFKDVAASGSHGMKQILAGYNSGSDLRDAGATRSFTAILTESLSKLGGSGAAFTTKKLLEEVSKHARALLNVPPVESADLAAPPASGSPAMASITPTLVTMTAGKFGSLCLGPLAHRDSVGPLEDLLDPRSVMDLRFDEERVLICTTFLGAADSDLSFFTDRLSNTPALASCVSLEAMFLGPPTTLLISMPQYVYDLLQGNKICLFLGQISSHNMLHLYHQLADQASSTAGIRESHPIDAQRTQRPDNSGDAIGVSPPNGRQVSHSSTSATAVAFPGALSDSLGPKHDGEESAEMKEAAEQLKALKHLRQRGGEAPPSGALTHQRTMLPDGVPTRHELPVSLTSHNSAELGSDGISGLLAPHISQTRLIGQPHHHHQQQQQQLQQQQQQPPQRRPLTRKADLQCEHCDHAPFKDSSSLRKHTAAAHTRPFPCSFSFAGCQSTFGSKNEWKRHMATQHIASQFYRCSQCPRTKTENREFNRLDLLRSHIRRLHTPQSIKQAQADSREKLEWDGHVKEVAQKCLVTRRLPPQRCACPSTGCQVAFEGPAAWDEWTEHVGKHMERGDGHLLGVDSLLAQWALVEGIIEGTKAGGYKICEAAASAAGNGNGAVINHGFAPSTDININSNATGNSSISSSHHVVGGGGGGIVAPEPEPEDVEPEVAALVGAGAIMVSEHEAAAAVAAASADTSYPSELGQDRDPPRHQQQQNDGHHDQQQQQKEESVPRGDDNHPPISAPAATGALQNDGPATAGDVEIKLQSGSDDGNGGVHDYAPAPVPAPVPASVDDDGMEVDGGV